MIVSNLRGFHMGDAQPVQFQGCTFSEAVDDFAFLEANVCFFLDFGKHVLQVRIGQFAAAALADLHHKHRVHVGIMLLCGIQTPAGTLFQPFLHGSFQQHDVVFLCRILRIGNDDPILQKARAAHLLRRDNVCIQADVGGVADQGVKPLRRGADAKHHRHGAHAALDPIFGILIPFDEALHDRGVFACLPGGFCAAVRLINDEIQPVRLALDRIVQCLPDRILPIIGMLGQFSAPADLLRVQKINMPILQHLHVEGFFGDGHTLAIAQLVGFQLDLLLGLLIQLRGIGQPDENRLRLLVKGCTISKCHAEIDAFDQGGGNDGLTCAGGRLQRDDLCFVPHPIGIQRRRKFLAQFLDSFVLEGDQIHFHLAFLPALMRKLSR